MITIYTDAAASGDPGEAAAGIIIKKESTISEYPFLLGVKTNHEAEFLAVIKALEICKEKFPGELLSIRTDAKVVVDILEKNYTKNERFLPLFTQIRELEKHFSLVFYKWIPEKQNKQADRLARNWLRQNKKHEGQ